MSHYGHGSPKRIYSWDVDLGSGGQGGVTDDRQAAITYVHDALSAAEPGASGHVRRVGLSQMGTPSYVELDTVGRAWREDGGVVWRGR